MRLDRALLRDTEIPWLSTDEFHALSLARGSYSPLQFVLRLRPDIHAILETGGTSSGIVQVPSFQQAEAFSVYLHETIHWWQHVGTTMGLMLSLLQPAHAHLNRDRLCMVLRAHGPVKSLRQLAAKMADTNDPAAPTDESLHYVLNNWHDLEFFRQLVIAPKTLAKQVVQHEYFLSVGHAYQVTLGAIAWLLSATVDPRLEVLPDPRLLEVAIAPLRINRHKGFYEGSPTEVPPLGAREIFEGQARFSQIQYLYGASGGKMTWEDLDECGLLSGVYFEAFTVFLGVIDKEMPSTPDDPLVGLFLLICDLAANPSEGLLTPIVKPEALIQSTDAGWRFFLLCRAAKAMEPSTLTAIKSYCADEYWDVSERLCAAIGSPSPRHTAELVVHWSKTHEGWKNLTAENESFIFDPANLPVRVFMARYVSYQHDKLSAPQFFCWPGMCMTAYRNPMDMNVAKALFDEHSALFVDKPDRDVYPRILPSRTDSAVHQVFESFYVWVSVYELTRQWIVQDGEFEYDFLWLTSKHLQEHVKAWAANNFEMSWGIHPDKFTPKSSQAY